MKREGRTGVKKDSNDNMRQNKRKIIIHKRRERKRRRWRKTNKTKMKREGRTGVK